MNSKDPQSGTSRTGTPDETFNLVSVLYHLLRGAQTYQKYVDDAAQAGDHEAARFIREVQHQNQKLADRAKQLLSRRLASKDPDEERVDEASMESFPASDPPAHH